MARVMQKLTTLGGLDFKNRGYILARRELMLSMQLGSTQALTGHLGAPIDTRVWPAVDAAAKATAEAALISAREEALRAVESERVAADSMMLSDDEDSDGEDTSDAASAASATSADPDDPSTTPTTAPATAPTPAPATSTALTPAERLAELLQRSFSMQQRHLSGLVASMDQYSMDTAGDDDTLRMVKQPFNALRQMNSGFLQVCKLVADGVRKLGTKKSSACRAAIPRPSAAAPAAADAPATDDTNPPDDFWLHPHFPKSQRDLTAVKPKKGHAQSLNNRDGCRGTASANYRPKAGECVLRYADVRRSWGKPRLLGFLTNFRFWSAGKVRPREVVRHLDRQSLTCGDAKGGEKPLLQTRHATTQKAYGLDMCHAFLTRAGPREDGWLSLLNVMRRQCRGVMSGHGGSAARKPAFCMCDKEATNKNALAERCSEVVSGIGSSKAQYSILQDAFKCVSWPLQKASGEKLLQGWATATAATFGLRGERSGLAIDPAWTFRHALESALFAGVALAGKGAPPATEKFGLVYNARPMQLMLTFRERHAQLFAGSGSHARNVLQYIGEKLFDDRAKLSSVMPLPARIGTLRSDRTRRTLILTLPDETVRNTVVREAPGQLGIDVSGGIANVDLIHGCDAMVLWSGGTEGTEKIKHAGIATQCQMLLPVREMQHSYRFVVPWLLYHDDDQFGAFLPHARAPLPSGLSTLETLQDLCDSPFQMGGHLLTACGKWSPDMKSTFSFNGREQKGTKGQTCPVCVDDTAGFARMPLGINEADTCAADTHDEWQWGDTADGSMGLASRGLFAQQPFELDHYVPMFKLMILAFPAVSTVKAVSETLLEAAIGLQSSDEKTQDAAFETARTQVDLLRPLLASKQFGTTVANGAPLVRLATVLGRRRPVAKRGRGRGRGRGGRGGRGRGRAAAAQKPKLPSKNPGLGQLLDQHQIKAPKTAKVLERQRMLIEKVPSILTDYLLPEALQHEFASSADHEDHLSGDPAPAPAPAASASAPSAAPAPPPPPDSGCHTALIEQPDGGIVPLLTAVYKDPSADLPATLRGRVWRRTVLAQAVKCMAKTLQTHVDDIINYQGFNKGNGHFWEDPVDLAAAYVEANAWAVTQQAKAGHVLSEPSTRAQLNQRTVTLLDRIGQQVVRFQACIATREANPDGALSCALGEMKKVLSCRFTDRNCEDAPSYDADKSSSKWLTKGSTERTAWAAADGFNGMAHLNTMVGGEQQGAYTLELLHAVKLRAVGGIGARQLRLAKLLDADVTIPKPPGVTSVFQCISEKATAAGLYLTDCRGAWHYQRFHGKQASTFLEEGLRLSSCFPEPYHGAFEAMEDILPFVVGANVDEVYPARQYADTCTNLASVNAAAIRRIHIAGASLYPTISREGGGVYGFATPPSIHALVTHVEGIFERLCEHGGPAAFTAEAFELGHIPLRKIYWTRSYRGQHVTSSSSRKRHHLEEVAKHLFNGKFRLWKNAARLAKAVQGVHRRHTMKPRLNAQAAARKPRQERRREELARALAAIDRWDTCAENTDCVWHAIAADGRGEQLWSVDPRNPWLKLDASTLEEDDSGGDTGGGGVDPAVVETPDLDPLQDPDEATAEEHDAAELERAEEQPHDGGSQGACFRDGEDTVCGTDSEVTSEGDLIEHLSPAQEDGEFDEDEEEEELDESDGERLPVGEPLAPDDPTAIPLSEPDGEGPCEAEGDEGDAEEEEE